MDEDDKKLSPEVYANIPLAPPHPIENVKVKCPVCDVEMLSHTLDFNNKPLKSSSNFRYCPICGTQIKFSERAKEIIFQREHK